MASSRCPCGHWFSSTQRGDRTYCCDHSLERGLRINWTLFNTHQDIPKLSSFDLSLRRQYADLFATFDMTDSTSCRMISLALRPDIAGVRAASKALFRHCGSHDRTNYVSWLLVAHRLFDPACIQSVLVPFCLGDQKAACLIEFDVEHVRKLQRELRDYNEAASLVVFGTNPAGRSLRRSSAIQQAQLVHIAAMHS
jgi:hypothetical protein